MSKRCLNSTVLIGNVGSNKYYDEKKGNPILIFDVATDRQWTKKSTGEKQEATQWHKVVAFGGLAKVVRDMVNTGGRVFVSGRLDYNKKGDEVNAQIVADEIIIVDRGGSTDNTDYAGDANDKNVDTGNYNDLEEKDEGRVDIEF